MCVGERRKQKYKGYGYTVLYMDMGLLHLMIVTEWWLRFACSDDGAGSTGQVQAKDCPITNAEAEK